MQLAARAGRILALLHGRRQLPSSLLQAAPVQLGYLKVGGIDHALFVGANVVGRANDESQRRATIERFQSQRNLHQVHGEFPAAARGMILPSMAGASPNVMPRACLRPVLVILPGEDPGRHCAPGLAGLQHMPA